MTRKGIELVCFDVGGVLLRCVSDWSDACRRAGVRSPNNGFTSQQFSQLMAFSHEFETGRINAEQFAAAMHREAGYEPAHVNAVLEAWLIELYPGIAELLDELPATNVTTALLSNTNPRHWQMICSDGDRFAALRRVHHRFASHEVGARKPDAAIYEHVERVTGVDPECIVFFDDKEENLTGAVFQLWNAELVEPDRDPARQLRRYLHRYGVLQASTSA